MCEGVAVWGSCGVGEMQCGGISVWVSFSVEELQCGEKRCGGAAVWGNCSVGELWCGRVAVCGSCSVGELQCGDDALWGCCSVGEMGWGVTIWGAKINCLKTKRFLDDLNILVACTLCPSVRRLVAVHEARDLWRSALLDDQKIF